MKVIYFLFLYFIYNCVHCDRDVWEAFKKTYNKNYENDIEENYRKSIFFGNLQLIMEHNQKYNKNFVTYALEINQFADLKINEIAKSSQPNKITQIKNFNKFVPKTDVPESIDWRDYGVITPIVDQSYCLSCWAFAVVAAIEGHVGIHLDKKNQTLSQENLIDCVYPDFYCKQEMRRSALEDSYKYIIENRGINTLKSYPYDQVPEKCRFTPENVGATIQEYNTVTEGDKEELKAVVGTLGPVAVIITADLTFTFYRKGVYYNKNCSNAEEPYNHAVTIIGYGTENGEDYWLVRNEWGHLFGEDGHIRMARNRDNNCGIATYASYPIVKKQYV